MTYLPIAAAAALLAVSASAAAQTAASNPIGVSRAVALAEERTGAGAYDAELDRDRGRAVYEIDLARGGSLYEVHIDAATGRILSASQPRIANMLSGWNDDEFPKTARRIAPMLAELERETSGTVREVSFDDDGGIAHYEVEIATAAGVADLRFDAATGKRMPIAYDD